MSIIFFIMLVTFVSFLFIYLAMKNSIANLLKYKKLCAFIILFFLGNIFLLYYHVGYYSEVRSTVEFLDAEKFYKNLLTNIDEKFSPRELIAKLKQRLNLHPKEIQGFYILSQIYFSIQEEKKGLTAIKEAYNLAPSSTEIAIAYVQAKLRNNEIKGCKLILQKILEQEPENQQALNLYAALLFKEKDYENAILYWRRLLVLLEPDNELFVMVKKMIAKAISTTVR